MTENDCFTETLSHIHIPTVYFLTQSHQIKVTLQQYIKNNRKLITYTQYEFTKT